jgi:hypothetical protein
LRKPSVSDIINFISRFIISDIPGIIDFPESAVNVPELKMGKSWKESKAGNAITVMKVL